MKKNLLVFLIIFVLFSLISRSCGNNTSIETTLTQDNIGLATNKITYAYGKEVKIEVQNNLAETVTIDDQCHSEPLDVYQYKDNGWLQVEASHDLDCTDAQYVVAPGESITLSYSNWVYSLFDELGIYRIEFDLEGQTYYSNEFTIEAPGLLTTFWREAFYSPIYNALIFLISVLPNHSLALAIILVTLIIRTILLIPSQHAIRSQRKMQDIQPKLEEVKKKYAGNQEKIAMETMKIWQENKVNPLGSCLPLLIQFPILIALFYAIKEGLNPDKVALLYEFQKDFSMTSIDTGLFGIFDLTKIDIYFFPIAVGILQFIQMRLALAKKATKKIAEKKPAKKNAKQDLSSDMEQANKMMQYFMPLMIAFFTASIPSGVGLYWGTSTLYGIIQQIVANRESTKKEPTIKVIEKE